MASGNVPSPGPIYQTDVDDTEFPVDMRLVVTNRNIGDNYADHAAFSQDWFYRIAGEVTEFVAQRETEAPGSTDDLHVTLCVNGTQFELHSFAE